jgi:hypothetical protein
MCSRYQCLSLITLNSHKNWYEYYVAQLVDTKHMKPGRNKNIKTTLESLLQCLKDGTVQGNCVSEVPMRRK